MCCAPAGETLCAEILPREGEKSHAASGAWPELVRRVCIEKRYADRHDDSATLRALGLLECAAAPAPRARRRPPLPRRCVRPRLLHLLRWPKDVHGRGHCTGALRVVAAAGGQR